ncbi:unnamed protein product [Pleuronectes platessa]|uniref:Uncharacterized protein n=1 Tax=Pleuronectes platessa TaxID=8262 RepID=A0A9N7V0J5_PLEPL|nr:unnamed protein product [Pleuronectes platessa]
MLERTSVHYQQNRECERSTTEFSSHVSLTVKDSGTSAPRMFTDGNKVEGDKDEGDKWWRKRGSGERFRKML